MKSKNQKIQEKPESEEQKETPFPFKGLFGSLLIFLWAFFISSFFQIGGRFGEILLNFTKEKVGIFGFFLLSFLFLIFGINVFRDGKILKGGPFLFGFFLIFLGLLGIFGFFSFELAGNFGEALSSFAKEYLGELPGILLYLLLIFSGSLLIFHFSFLRSLKIQFRFPGSKKEFEIEEGKPEVLIKKILPIRTKTLAPKKEKLKKEEEIEGYFLPLSLLEDEKEDAISGDIENNAKIIKKTLATFGIEVEMGEIHVGPTVTQYTLRPKEGIKLSKIVSLQNDLALGLAAHPIRIEAPIPGKSLVGIEIPNKKRAYVRLKSLISSEEFIKGKPLLICLGKDVKGERVFVDLEELPHLLVAGATGTGKTVFLNSLILSLLWKNSPRDLRLILIDPKRVEFTPYIRVPHLLTPPIVEHQDAILSLKWLIQEMEERFLILEESGQKDIQFFKKYANKKKWGEMPYILLVIDELADIMATKGKEFEALVVRLAQLSRAVGIHLVLSTQRPSVEVLTGLIKANITSRIAFRVASQVDSRTILDMGGAERLLGNGDMLFLSPRHPKPKRIQACFVHPREIERVTKYLTSQREKEDFLALKFQERLKALSEKKEATLIEEEIDDELYEEAKRVVVRARKASASLLQRKLKIGYARAARLLDLLEKRKVIGPSQGAKPREVYLKEEDFSLK